MNRFSFNWICVLILISCLGCGRGNVTYTLVPMDEGGYELDVHYQRRRLSPITAEGMFPVETGTYRITIYGKGQDWSYKGRTGFYYSPVEITSDQRAWDYCFAWMDAKREYLYLNAYWLDPPDNIVRANVAGKYVFGEKMRR